MSCPWRSAPAPPRSPPGARGRPASARSRAGNRCTPCHSRPRRDRPCPRGSPPRRRNCQRCRPATPASPFRRFPARSRSEEHTSELQSHVNLVCRLLLEKKKKTFISLHVSKKKKNKKTKK